MGAPRSGYAVGIEQISKALIASGYRTLDAQAKALGVHRNTAWTIVNKKHKLGRLSAKTTQRILANPETLPAVRIVIEKYLAERSDFFRTHSDTAPKNKSAST